jgi:CubicO group peptidase (beta-lactamase class C family)
MDIKIFKNMARVAGGNAYLSKNYKLQPSHNPFILTNRSPTKNESSICNSFHNLFQKNSCLSLIVYSKGNIIYENYRKPASESCPLFSWSMSKSLIAFTLGYLLSEEIIEDLNDTGSKYSKDLDGTVFGETSLRNMLTMSSGVRRSKENGNQSLTEWHDMTTGSYSTVDHLKIYGKKEMEPGHSFNYSGTDTEAICNIIDNNGGFLNYFEKYIWQPSQCENMGYWMLEKNDRAVSQAGFSAVARDWIRIGLHTIRELKSSNTIVRNYMREATSPQIRNNNIHGNTTLRYYGYQTWIGDFNKEPSYWLCGMGGIRLGIDPVNDKIVYVCSYDSTSDYVRQIYRTFNDFQNLI